MKLTVTLDDYLNILRGEEAKKPDGERKEVPTISDLADGTGLHRVTVSNLINNNMKQINIETISAIVNELKARGFDVKVSDVLDFRVPRVKKETVG